MLVLILTFKSDSMVTFNHFLVFQLAYCLLPARNLKISAITLSTFDCSLPLDPDIELYRSSMCSFHLVLQPTGSVFISMLIELSSILDRSTSRMFSKHWHLHYVTTKRSNSFIALPIQSAEFPAINPSIGGPFDLMEADGLNRKCQWTGRNLFTIINWNESSVIKLVGLTLIVLLEIRLYDWGRMDRWMNWTSWLI